MILFEPFYRKRGIRLITHLVQPPINNFNQLLLPKNSSIHFPMWDEEVTSISQDHFLLREIKKIMYLHISEFYSTDTPLNAPKLNPQNFNKPIRDHYMQNRRFRKTLPETSVKDETTMVCYTHALLNRRYKYIGKKLSAGFSKWHDYYDTVFTTMNTAMDNDTRNHFVIIEAPTHLPSLNNLKMCGIEPVKWNLKIIRRFHNNDHWLVWAFWRLLQGDIEGSGIFRNLSPKYYKRTNIILTCDDQCIILNLEKFLRFSNAWDDKWAGFGLEKTEGMYDALRFGKYFLNLLMVIQEQTTNIADESEIAEDGDRSLREDSSLSDDGGEYADKAKERTQTTKLLDELFPQHVAEMTKEAMKPKTKGDDKKPTPEVNKEGEMVFEDDGVETEVDIDEQIDERLNTLEELNGDDELTDKELEAEEGDDDGDVINSAELVYSDYRETLKEAKAEDQALDVAKGLARSGTLTAGELRRADKLAKKYKQLKNPYGGEGNFEDLLSISKEDIQLSGDDVIANEKTVDLIPDKSMAKSTLKTLDDKYVKKVLPKHMSQSVMSLNKMGITVQKYDVDKVTTMMDEFEVHSIQVCTVAGKQSTIRFRVPTVDGDGYIKVNGVKYIMRKQWNDLPIRKISAMEVALTSYYSKLFVNRTERAAFNYDKWLSGQLVTMVISDDRFSDVKYNNVFNNHAALPREYTITSRRLAEFTYGGFHFNFDYKKIEEMFGVKPEQGKIPVAYKTNDKKNLMYMDSEGLLHNGKHTYVFEEFLGVDTTKAPQDYAEMVIYGKTIPLVYLLGYRIGLGNLLKTLKIDYLRLRKQSEATEGFLTVRFKDEILAVNKKDQVACLILSGLNRFKNDLRRMSIYDFDGKDAWATVFEHNGVDQRYLKETQTMFPLWVDPITEGILKEMGEPTDLVLLLIRAVELLLIDQHPDSMDTKYMRIRGYERISGFMYSELVKAMRDYNYRPARKDKQFSLHPDSVWYSIVRDESMTVKEGSNPIHNLKEQEILVYRGTGGRSADSMMGESRMFHENASGIVSEATVDSGDVGTITYLSANPSLANMYGMVDPVAMKGKSKKDIETAKVISTSFLLSPGSDIDDPKRVGFVSVQNSQTMATRAYELMPSRTGYERVIGGRLGETFCVNAKLDGKVTNIADDVVTVEFSDGTEERYTIGTTYHPWSGNTVPQTSIIDLKAGDAFKQGDTIIYNPNFFKRDGLQKNTVTFTHQMLARVAIVEGGDVFEDSCAISAGLSERMQADIAHVRHITLDDAQDIKDLIPVGAEVYPDSILCTILNTQTDTQFYDSDTMKLLEKLGSVSPKAKYKGTVTKIDVIYTGDVETMADNVKQVALKSDRDLYRHSKRKGTPIDGGRVDIGFRVDGKPLGKNATVIRVHIVENLQMHAGDKLVVGNQLKGTVARVWTTPNVDENDKEFDAYFSGNSIDARIVNSPFLMGTTNTLMMTITQQVVDAYFTEDD